MYSKDNVSKLYPLSVEYFLNKRAIWGGGCDIYTMSETDAHKLEDYRTRCHRTGDSINVKFSVGPSVVKEGYKIKACEEIVAIDNSVRYALSRVSLSESSEFTLDNVKRIYSLFYPERKTTGDDVDQVILALQEISLEETGIDGWRYILLTLCYDPGWQIL